jgi:GGDEF domain-containing protein
LLELFAAPAALIESLQKLVEINNQFYPGKPLSLSVGAATSEPGERLEDVVKRADMLMFDAKRAYYATTYACPRDSSSAA